MNAHVERAIDANGAGRANQPAGSALELLFDGVDDLIRRVADVENPEIRKVRAKVHAALVAAKSALEAKEAPEDGANRVHREAVQVAESTDEDLTDEDLLDYSGQALGVALLVGLGLGLI